MHFRHHHDIYQFQPGILPYTNYFNPYPFNIFCMDLIIQPFGYIEERIFRKLQKGLAPYFEEIDMVEELPIPQEAFNDYRKQFLVDTFMMILKSIKGDKVLGIVDRDLYTPELNFIYGKGRINGRHSIIALERLRDGATRKMFLDRVLKEAVHELGHTDGLRHCKNKLCVMHFSNTIEDTDIKTAGYCKKCEKLLE